MQILTDTLRQSIRSLPPLYTLSITPLRPSYRAMSYDQIGADTENYLTKKLHLEDEVLKEARQRARKGGLMEIAVGELQGKHLEIIARQVKAKKILEIGTLGGYSTINLARALGSDGQLDTLELNPVARDIAQGNLDSASLPFKPTIHLGPALDTLKSFQTPSEGDGYDLVFIDADKGNSLNYLLEALRLSKPGATLLLDNMVREGEISIPTRRGEAVSGQNLVYNWIDEQEKKGTSPIITTVSMNVGNKGWDGMLIAWVKPKEL